MSKHNSAETKERILAAAAHTLRTEGYAGTSARTIAKAAGCNSALIFYHFGGVDPLLLAALDRSSQERMAAHREAVAGARTLEELVEVATGIYRADLEGGHITLFSELVGASIARPELKEEIVTRSEPWIEFVEETLERVIGGSPLAKLMPPRDLAYAAITFYLGVNLFTHLDADRTRTESLFNLAARVAPRAKLLTMRLPRRKQKPAE
ncbi:TetR/AcrR family transcriptional regulator [Actinomadura rudentiformis]|uniref:TetR/AcrR family transcriptional regulator n=1 Tax=Actinomadura rudentiformis TaxID=359158 RepID=A0A6H9YHC9_9ACTN|nr:TetR/AcrR family transcriptional regulator [Actinomadura rudentiformis]KAB2345196.1 TetR/AcrR family transcriptional regulator [Actinomadura rudentiformis]